MPKIMLVEHNMAGSQSDEPRGGGNRGGGIGEVGGDKSFHRLQLLPHLLTIAFAVEPIRERDPMPGG